MRFKLTFSVAACLTLHTSYAAQQQPFLTTPEGPGETRSPSARVAIIGAGAAGSSAAYHLAQYAREANIPLNITIFERNSYIGGRSTTVNIYDDSTLTAELGASIFVEVNHILVEAVKAFNLTTSAFGAQARAKLAAPSLGIWNGDEFVVTLGAAGPSWWDTAKLLWRYGLAPIKTRSLMKSTVGRFLKMYEEPHFPFPSLRRVVNDVELTYPTSITGLEYLASAGVSRDFAHEIVQASTRVNYAQNLAFIHGLETMVCMATDGAMSVEGGNWQIFDHMIRSSGAHVMTKTEVNTIRGGRHDTIIVKADTLLSDGKSKSHESEFDGLIIAAPYHQTGITTENFEPFDVPEKVLYVELHVTLFTSPHPLSPDFFSLPQGQAVPLTILTTLPEGDLPDTGPQAAGRPGFFSISTLDVVENPRTGAQEYLYKIFSPQKPSASWLLNLIGVEDDNADHDKHITWLTRKLWKSYPVERPRTDFDDIGLTRTVWYTGGMDPFISTMETNALMGKNIARLIADAVIM